MHAGIAGHPMAGANLTTISIVVVSRVRVKMSHHIILYSLNIMCHLQVTVTIFNIIFMSVVLQQHFNISLSEIRFG